MSNADAKLRQELLDAREVVMRQIDDLQNPIRGPIVYDEGITKLRNTLAEIEEALARLTTPDP